MSAGYGPCMQGADRACSHPHMDAPMRRCVCITIVEVETAHQPTLLVLGRIVDAIEHHFCMHATLQGASIRCASERILYIQHFGSQWQSPMAIACCSSAS